MASYSPDAQLHLLVTWIQGVNGMSAQFQADGLLPGVGPHNEDIFRTRRG